MLRKKKKKKLTGDSLKLRLLRLHTDPKVQVRHEARVQSNFMEAKDRCININANRLV